MLAFLEGPELVVVLVVLALVLGTSRLPKLARQLGQAQQELKKGLAEGADADDDEDQAPTALPASKQAAIEAKVTEVSTAPAGGERSLPAPDGPIPPPSGVTAPTMPPPLQPPTR